MSYLHLSKKQKKELDAIKKQKADLEAEMMFKMQEEEEKEAIKKEFDLPDDFYEWSDEKKLKFTQKREKNREKRQRNKRNRKIKKSLEEEYVSEEERITGTSNDPKLRFEKMTKEFGQLAENSQLMKHKIKKMSWQITTPEWEELKKREIMKIDDEKYRLDCERDSINDDKELNEYLLEMENENLERIQKELEKLEKLMSKFKKPETAIEKHIRKLSEILPERIDNLTPRRNFMRNEEKLKKYSIEELDEVFELIQNHYEDIKEEAPQSLLNKLRVRKEEYHIRDVDEYRKLRHIFRVFLFDIYDHNMME